ncbi:hypothetical protein GW17_00032498 [Ensete ventricosum]|nr:hypothetical protein GW17_00032498 [Ensete ventricosum]
MPPHPPPCRRASHHACRPGCEACVCRWGVPTLPVPGRLYDNWRPPYDRSATCVGLATSTGQLSEDGTSEKDDPETGKLAKRSKRTSKSVGLSSFVSRKKKIKKETTSPSEQ